MNQCEYMPMMKIQPNFITFYDYYIGHRTEAMNENEKNLRTNGTGGEISEKAAKRIGRAVDWLLTLATEKNVKVTDRGKDYQFKVAFITLTLPAAQGLVSDDLIKSKLLNNFLTQARQKWNVKKYLWKAEAQANGNIHFHVIIDKFIKWQEIRDTWNKICNKYGYIEQYRNKHKHLSFKEYLKIYPVSEKRTFAELKRAYNYGVETSWSSPNTTDIHSIKNIKSLRGYITKEFTKNQDGRRKITGRVWFLSRSLTACKGLVLCAADFEKDCEIILKAFKDKIINTDYCKVLTVPATVWSKLKPSGLVSVFKKHLEAINNKINAGIDELINFEVQTIDDNKTAWVRIES